MTQNDVWNSFQSFILQVEEDPIMFLMDSNKPKLHKKALIRFFLLHGSPFWHIGDIPVKIRWSQNFF